MARAAQHRPRTGRAALEPGLGDFRDRAGLSTPRLPPLPLISRPRRRAAAPRARALQLSTPRAAQIIHGQLVADTIPRWQVPAGYTAHARAEHASEHGEHGAPVAGRDATCHSLPRAPSDRSLGYVSVGSPDDDAAPGIGVPAPDFEDGHAPGECMICLGELAEGPPPLLRPLAPPVSAPHCLLLLLLLLLTDTRGADGAGEWASTLPCDHVFHHECISKWLQTKVPTFPLPPVLTGHVSSLLPY